MYKQASKLKLRFQTPKGVLSVEQLWDGLSMTELYSTIKVARKNLRKDDDDELSFLEDSKVIDTEGQLAFDILKDVYLTRKKEQEEARTASANKANNQKILTLIAEKKEEHLKSMSVGELEALLK